MVIVIWYLFFLHYERQPKTFFTNQKKNKFSLVFQFSLLFVTLFSLLSIDSSATTKFYLLKVISFRQLF